MKNLKLAGMAGVLAITAAMTTWSSNTTGASMARAAGDQATNPMFDSVAGKAGPALVMVKMVAKMPGRDEGQEMEVPGTMIDADGLVIVSNARIGGMATRMGGTPPALTDVKVLIGDDTEGLSAKVWTRDSEIDLAWVKIDDEKAKGRKFDFLDLSSSASPKSGDVLYAAQKMGKFFDRTVQVSMGYVAATTKKPRPLIVPGGALNSTYGLPVFAGDGKIAGIMVVQVPDAEESDSAAGGGFEGPMILPASEAAAATKKAKEAPAPTEPAPEAAGEKKDGEPAEKAAEGEPKKDEKKTDPKP